MDKENNYTKIQVECDSEGYGITACPYTYKTDKVLAGAMFCSCCCKFYRGRNHKEKQLYCSFPIDELQKEYNPIQTNSLF